MSPFLRGQRGLLFLFVCSNNEDNGNRFQLIVNLQPLDFEGYSRHRGIAWRHQAFVSLITISRNNARHDYRSHPVGREQVRLMTAVNFQRFTEKLDYKFAGGVAKKSPIKLVIPDSAHWHLVVDAEGHHGLADFVRQNDRPSDDQRACERPAQGVLTTVTLAAQFRPPVQPLADIPLETAFGRIIKCLTTSFSGK